MKISEIKNLTFKPFLKLNSKNVSYPSLSSYSDSFIHKIENDFDKSVLVKRGILDENKDLSKFFDEISAQIFNDKRAETLSSYLKGGYVSLSTSCYKDIKSPQSAKGVVLNPSKTPAANCARLEEEIKEGNGVGINFSEFKNPIENIRKINSYFKYRDNSVERHPAGIALLNINHPQILDFITLKDNEDFNDWCFDLSVVIPSDFIMKVSNNDEVTLSNGKTLRAKVIYNTLLSSMAKTGEPGIIFSDEPNYICDCCATAPLKENEKLTLAHVNLSKFYKASKFDLDELKKASDILSQAMKNIDPNGYIGVVGYQTLLDKMGLNYGEIKANNILESSLKTIREQASHNGIKMAISPTGGVSRFLKVSPSIEPKDNSKIGYFKEIDTLALAQRYIDGNISKTVILKQDSNIDDVGSIVRYCEKSGIKGISVYKPHQ